MDNEYLSPYAVTVIYNGESLLESAIAMACSRAQLIQWDKDKIPIIDSPTPDLIIIDPLINGFLSDQLVNFLMSMTNRVHILTEAAGKHDHLIDQYPAIIDEFTFANLYQYVKPSSSAVLYALEQVITGNTSNFTPSFKDITPESGKYFCLMLTSADHLGEIYNSGFRCFQTVEIMVAAGKVLNDVHEKEIETLISNARCVKSDSSSISHYAIMANEKIHQDIVEKVKVKNQLSIVFSPHINSDRVIWKVTAVGDGAYEFLKKHDVTINADVGGLIISTFTTCDYINNLVNPQTVPREMGCRLHLDLTPNHETNRCCMGKS